MYLSPALVSRKLVAWIIHGLVYFIGKRQLQELFLLGFCVIAACLAADSLSVLGFSSVRDVPVPVLILKMYGLNL